MIVFNENIILTDRIFHSYLPIYLSRYSAVPRYYTSRCLGWNHVLSDTKTRSIGWFSSNVQLLIEIDCLYTTPHKTNTPQIDLKLCYSLPLTTNKLFFNFLKPKLFSKSLNQLNKELFYWTYLNIQGFVDNLVYKQRNLNVRRICCL